VARRVPQIVLAHKGGVLPRLVGCKMRHETTVAEGRGVAVHDEHAPLGAGQGNHLAETIFGVEVTSE
jgi:hypothetical protein